MVNLEIEQGNTRSRKGPKGTSSESLKVIDERKCFDIDLDVQSLIHDDTKADVNSSSNPTKESGEIKKRKKKKKSFKADDKDGMQNTEQTDTMPIQSPSDEHHTERNEDKVKRIEPNLEQGVEGSFVDTPSVKLSIGQKKRRKKRRKMEQNGNDKDAMNIMDETEIMSVLSLSGEHGVPGNEDKLKKVENELKQEVEGSFVDDENTPSTKECVEEKKKGRREKRRKGKANDKDGMQSMDQADIMSMGSLSDEHRVKGNEDKLKRVEHELKHVVEGSFVDDENTGSAKESVEQKKERRRRRKDRKANDKGGIQSMDQTDIISMGSLSDENCVQGNEDKLKRVEHELKQEVEGSFVDAEQKKKGRREKRMKGKTNVKGGLQNMDQADIISAGSLSDEHRVQGNKDKLKTVEHELKQEVQGSCVDDDNTASAKECVEQKKERRRRKDRKANDGLCDEHHVREDRDKPKRVEHELGRDLQGSVVDDENTQSAKESVEPKKERRRRMKKKDNGTDGIQSMDQTDVTSIRSLCDELYVQEDEDKPKRVVHELDEELEGSVVDNENTRSAKQSEEPEKGRRRRKKKKDNNKDGIQSMDQTDVTSIRSLCDDYQVQGNKDELERAENELEREVEQSFVDCENTPPANDCVKAKRKKRRGKKKQKANVNGGTPGKDKKDVDDLLMGSNPSLGKTLVSFPRRKLLVLDINGLLADVVHPPPKHCKADINIFRRAIFKRPFYYDFLKFCFERFDVGIWSSRSKRIIDPVVDYLLGELKHKLLFCWDLSYCTTSGFNTLENVHKPLVFKELRLIWEKSDPNFPWEKGDYNESNTLLLDDSPYKALINPKHTAIFPRSYTFMKRRDNSLGPGGDLRVYLEKVATAENVQTYVEKHPFGQVGIDKTSRSWDFYSRVLSKWSIVSVSTE